MLKRSAVLAISLGLFTPLTYPVLVSAQEAVIAAADKEALFTSADPKLHANKQVAYHIMRDLLEAGHWDKASTNRNPVFARARWIASWSRRVWATVHRAA